jgi:parallel beta-helix repeat protein
MDWTVTPDCNWLTVEPNSGTSSGEVDDANVVVDISGLAGGTYDCQLTVTGSGAPNSPQIVDVNLVVYEPVIELSSAYLEFTAFEGGANPAEQILSISNSGTGTLNWQIAKGCGWLTAEPNSGSSTGEVDDVNLSVDIGGLSAGVYDCNLTISDPNASNSPQIVEVNLVVYEPVIELSSTYFEFTAYAGGANPADKTLSISNSGTGTLNWQISEDCNWLSAEPNIGSSTGEADDVNLSVDITGLAAGVYECNLTVSDANASNSPQVVDVNVVVVGPLIAVSTTQFRFTAIEGGADPNDQILGISNTGGGTLNWTVSEDCNWLSAEPNSGSTAWEVDDVNLSVDISGLGWGTYDCDLTISGPNATNSPQKVRITLSVYHDQLHVPSEYLTIQAAIDTAVNGDRVTVAPGTYNGNGNRDLDYHGKSITVQSIDPYEAAIVAGTVIDCEGTEVERHRGFYFHSSEDANSVVSGFTITNGWAENGGGIYIKNSAPTIKNCVIIGNDANAAGGGIYCMWTAYPTDATIRNCVITGNTAVTGGGVFNGLQGYTTMRNCMIRDNEADYGGGVWCGNSFFLFNSELSMDNCTVTGNTADYDGGGIYCYGSGSGYGIGNALRLTNSICWGDSDAQGYEVYISGHATDPNRCGATVSVSYSDVEGGRTFGIYVGSNCPLDWGAGNIGTNPAFVAGPLGDYYLSQTPGGRISPCVDAGSDTAGNLGLDIFTTRRIDQASDAGVVDMGYHYPVTKANRADISEDLYVDLFDFAILAWQWLDEPGVPSADIAPYSGDGVVDSLDLGSVGDSWLDCYVMAASNPGPWDGAVEVGPNVVLLWSAVDTQHDVYFGTDINSVAEANHFSAEFMGTFSDANFVANALDFNASHYWRIDEVGARCMERGEVWSFTTAPSWPWPECWYCPYQCYGDLNCLAFAGKRVTGTDRDAFLLAYPSYYPQPDYNPCADFDRDGYVSEDDNDIMMFWFYESGVPNDCPLGGEWPPDF